MKLLPNELIVAKEQMNDLHIEIKTLRNALQAMTIERDTLKIALESKK